MNIFVVDSDPTIAAKSLCDRHVVKMTLESAQMLSYAHRLCDGVLEKKLLPNKTRPSKHWKLSSKTLESSLYKVRVVHKNHPCTVWTMKSVKNYQWHYQHFLALCDEYTYRYNRVHKCDKLFRELLKIVPISIPDIELTPFAKALMKDPELMNMQDTVLAYKQYYRNKRTKFNMNWSKRLPPEWF